MFCLKGQGYLSQVLANQYGFRVIGLDAQPCQTAGALRKFVICFVYLSCSLVFLVFHDSKWAMLAVADVFQLHAYCFV